LLIGDNGLNKNKGIFRNNDPEESSSDEVNYEKLLESERFYLG
jgi:hypothetical protein